MKQKLSTGFAGMITAAVAWSVWGNDLFSTEEDPVGGGLTNIQTLHRRPLAIESLILKRSRGLVRRRNEEMVASSEFLD